MRKTLVSILPRLRVWGALACVGFALSQPAETLVLGVQSSAPAQTDKTEQPDQAGQSVVAPNTAPAAKPTPREGELTFAIQGARSIETSELLAALEPEKGAWERGLAGELITNDCAFEIEQFYLRRGFSSVKVSGTWDPNKRQIGITITEGARVVITAWQWPGAVDVEGLRPSELVALYRPESPPPLIQSELRALPGRLIDKHQALGYLRAEAGPVTIQPGGKPNEKQVTVPIQAGTRFRFGSLSHDLSPELEEEIGLKAVLQAAVPAASEGAYFLPAWVPQWTRAAQKALGKAGYVDALIQTERQIEGDQVRVKLSIRPGEVVRLGEIVLPEDLGLRESFLLKQLKLQSGDLLTPESLDSALVRLYRTGRFEQVRLQTRGQGTVRDLVMTATEQADREAFLEPGYGSFERSRLRAGWRHYNVGGVARSVRVEGVIAEKADRLLVGWNDPWTLPDDWILDATIDTQLRKLPAYSRRTSSIGAFGSKSFGEHLRWTTDLGLRHSRVSIQDIRVSLLGDATLADDLTSTTAEWGLRYDSRNHPLVPRKGQHATLALQHSLIATGSASPYSKIQMGWSGYYPVSERQTLAIGLRGTAVIPEGSGELPFGLRVFSGGENSVRSFRESELGPKDVNGTPVGGEALTTISVEFIQDLGESRWQLAAFADAGNVLSSASDWFEFADMESALGLGVRYLLPIGPLRLDWGYNPSPGLDDPESVLHFSVGLAF